MIQDLDRTLEQLLRDRVPLRDELIVFDVPDEAFRARLSRTGLTTNLYLYDIRENDELRSPLWTLERQPDGRLVKHRPKARINLFYLLTAWSPADPPDVLAEHGLLSRVLRALLRYPTLPPEVLQGALIGQEPPLPTIVAQPNGMGSPGEFWAALHQPPRPGIHLVVTIAVDPSALTDEPLSLVPVVSRGLGVGSSGGSAYRLGIRPALPLRYEQDARLRRMTDPILVAQLQQRVFASRNTIRVIQVNSLLSMDWILIDDAANPEFVRLGKVPGPGAQDIEVSPPLRFGHDPTAVPIPLRRATVPDSDVIATNLDAPTTIGSTTLRVADRGRLGVDDVLLISDEQQTEVAQVVSVTAATGAGDITVRPSLRFNHQSNRNLYKRLLEPAATATRLAQPAAQPGSPIILVDSNVTAAGVVLMVGAGPNVEFCQLDAAATPGTPVAITPPLRNNHPANTSLRRLTPADVVGRLAVTVSADSQEVLMVEEPSEVEQARHQDRPLVSAGEVLQIDDPRQPALAPSSFQLASVMETPSALNGTPEEFFAIGGWVTDNATPPSPVVGAQVTLTELGLTASTDAEGRFTFANLARGSYTLQVTAAGYQNRTKPVQVPAQSVNEYRVALTP